VSGDLNLLLIQRHIFESSVDASTKLVALALLNHWSRATETFPSVARLAVWCSLNRTTVMRCLSTLKQLGAIEVKTDKGRANRYELGQLSLLPVAPRDQSDNPTSRTTRPEPVAPRDPTSRTTRHEVIQEEIQEEIHTAVRVTDPPTKGVRKARARSQSKTALPADWQPSEAHREYAKKHGLQLDLEVDAFKGHADGLTALSWNGKFTTWLANQAKWNRQRRNGRGKAVVQRGGTVREGDKSWLEG
jgi:hypothetical protein